MSTSGPTQSPVLHALPAIPTGPDDAIVFANPWEAKAFALVVQLNRQGHFSWLEWTEQLSTEIAAAGHDDDGRDYYLLWLTAAEKLVAHKGLCDGTELLTCKDKLEAAQGGPAPVDVAR
jgi:nitrile hydratase accessory protein